MNDSMIYLVMGTSMIVTAVVIAMMRKFKWRTLLAGPLHIPKLPVEKRHIWGGVVFGIGWAVTGTCPTVSAAMLGSGKWLGVVVMAGLFVGVLAKDALNKKPR